ncbi:hypothetical protein TB2_028684 [Malus domestica]
MASSKIMSSSSTSLNSDLSRRPSNFSSTAKPKPTTATAHPSSSSAHPQTQNNSHNSITNSTSLLPIGPMTVGGLLYDSNPTFMIDATLLDTQITLLDTTCAAAAGNGEIELRSVFIRSDSLSPFGSIDKVERSVVGFGNGAKKGATKKGGNFKILGLGLGFYFYF